MAITAAALQAELGTNAMNEQVLRGYNSSDATEQLWLVSGGTTYPGRVRLITTTASDDAATQAAAVQTALLA